MTGRRVFADRLWSREAPQVIVVVPHFLSLQDLTQLERCDQGKHGRGSCVREGELSAGRIQRKPADKGWKKNLIEEYFRDIKSMCVSKCRTVCECKIETSPGYGGCTETCHHGPAVLEAQMEVCL